MRQLILGKAEHPQLSKDVLTQMHQLRYRVFHEKLQWNVGGAQGQEIDEYDKLNPYYMVAIENQQATACWRLLPTMGPYMLRDTFKELLRGEPLPKQTDAWELSRFAVLSPTRRHNGQIHLCETAYEMFDRLIAFADQRNISRYVTVVSTSVERLMTCNGISMQRFGDGQASNVDGISSVACWINLDQRTRSSVHNAMLYTKTA